MINNFLIISCTGQNNLLGIKYNNKFYKKKLQNNIKSNNLLVSNIISFIREYKVKLNDKYSILVNIGPGSYSSLRISDSRKIVSQTRFRTIQRCLRWIREMLPGATLRVLLFWLPMTFFFFFVFFFFYCVCGCACVSNEEFTSL